MSKHRRKSEGAPRLPQQVPDEDAKRRLRLSEPEHALRVICEGEVSAAIVSGSRGEQAFSLSESVSICRLMVEAMSEVALAVTPEGVVLFANHRLAGLLERPLEQIVGRSLESFSTRETASD